MRNPRIMLLLIVLSILQFSFSADEIKVTPDYNSEQISRVEQQVLKEFSKNIDIKVLKRGNDGKIIHLICIYYDSQSKEIASCESTSFGYLLVRKGGCTISNKP